MRLLVFLMLIIPTLVKAAHPVSLSWAKARITDNKITVNFKILAEDLYLFHKLHTDDNYDLTTSELQAAATRHGQLIQSYFFITQDNKSLDAELTLVNSESLNKEKINIMNLMKYEIHYTLIYTLAQPDWQALTFHQEFASHGIGIPSLTFLTVYNKNKALISDVEVSPGNPFVLKPNGNNSIKNPSELTSSFFTVTQSGVRHELTIPATVFSDLSYQHTHTSLFQQASTYFQNFNSIHINNARSNPQVRYIHSLQNDSSNTAGFVYIDLFYPARDRVNQARITWDDFNWQFRWFDTEILTIDSTYRHTFSRFQKEFLWEEKVKLIEKEN